MLELWVDYRLRDFIDILLVASIIYFVYQFLFGSRGFQVLKGIAIIVMAYFLGLWLELNTFIWLFKKALSVAAIALLIVFQNELRQIITKLGEQIQLFSSTPILSDDKQRLYLPDKLTQIAMNLADKKVGAIIVLVGKVGLKWIIENGIKLDAVISNELLETVFNTHTNFHDGACIIEKNRVVAVACFLPLTQQTNLSKVYGTRHLAAIGLSEESDAFVIIVSEERSKVSVALNGVLHKNLIQTDLQNMLKEFLLNVEKKDNKFIDWSSFKRYLPHFFHHLPFYLPFDEKKERYQSKNRFKSNISHKG